jgi:dihydrodipicolinate synthase/N-acetylneuraminate lyase
MLFRPEGIAPAMMTAFDDGGGVNAEVMGYIVDFCHESGCSSLFCASSSGEFVHLDTDEVCALMDIVVKAAAGRIPVLAGVTTSHIEKTLELARHARDIGCAGVVCAPPYYYPVSQGMIERHFELLAGEVPDLSVVMYNVPLFSTPISRELVGRLSRIPNVVALKDSSGSMVELIHFLDECHLAGSNITILAGREELLYPALMIGCRGAMVATANIFPEILVRIHDAALAGDHDSARSLQIAICRAIRTMFSIPFPHGFKLAMEVRGFRMGPPKSALSADDILDAGRCRSRLHDILSELCEFADIPLVRGRG